MASSLQLLLLLLLFLSTFLCSATSSQTPQAYVVYMGSSSAKTRENAEAAEKSHLDLVSSLSPRQESERRSLIHHYYHAIRGFSAMLTQSEASALSEREEVVSVFPDPILQLHTTRSWDFLELGSSTRTRSRYQHPSSDVIVGIIDTGIWPESPSFNDDGVGEIPSRWKGTCMEGSDFKKSNCNRKGKLFRGSDYCNPSCNAVSRSCYREHGFVLHQYMYALKKNTNLSVILFAYLWGALQEANRSKVYSVQPTSNNNNNNTHLTREGGSPRDSVGHGTHTASTAGGAPVGNASYYGLAKGTARGGSPSTRIASYKACSEDGCSGSTILKAIDDAIKDGVDIISISIGMNSLFQSSYLDYPIAIGAFHAEQMGILVVCSGGNEGPDPSTVVNTAPWVFTVAASSIDRTFESVVLLGNGKKFQGSAINFSNLTNLETYPLVFGESAAGKFTPAYEARNCYPGSLDSKKVAGKIVVCVASDPTLSRRTKKLVVEDAKAKGVILVDDNQNGNPFDSGVFPFSQVDGVIGPNILKYINSTKYPTATILPTTEVSNYKPAPVVASFSSRGPGGITENILKPDIMAPGVAILAAVVPKNELGSVPVGKKPSGYSIKSGTSMACPHVTGAASIVMSVHSGWNPSMIKSALMTTATVFDNMGKPLTNSSDFFSNPHEVGAGEISPYRALHPGLVFETTTIDYLHFLCYSGYSEKNIKAMSNTNFICPNKSTDELISTINYSSISIRKLDRRGPTMTVGRTVTNVGPMNATYMAHVHRPVGLAVKVVPEKIIFNEGTRKVSYNVSFNGKGALIGYNFGSLTWSDGRHAVRTVFSVNVSD